MADLHTELVFDIQQAIVAAVADAEVAPDVSEDSNPMLLVSVEVEGADIVVTSHISGSTYRLDEWDGSAQAAREWAAVLASSEVELARMAPG